MVRIVIVRDNLIHYFVKLLDGWAHLHIEINRKYIIVTNVY